MDEATFIEKADKYLDGVMQGAELSEFQILLDNDTDMEVKLSEHKRLRKNIRAVGREELATELGSIKKEIEGEEVEPKLRLINIKKWIPIAVAASVALLTGVFYFGEDSSQSIGNEEVTLEEHALLWEGEVDVRILPEEGKFGAGVKESKKVIIYKSDEEYFVGRNDEIIIYSEILENVELDEIELRGNKLILANSKIVFFKR